MNLISATLYSFSTGHRSALKGHFALGEGGPDIIFVMF